MYEFMICHSHELLHLTYFFTPFLKLSFQKNISFMEEELFLKETPIASNKGENVSILTSTPIVSKSDQQLTFYFIPSNQGILHFYTSLS